MSQEIEPKSSNVKRFIIPGVILAGVLGGGAVLSNQIENHKNQDKTDVTDTPTSTLPVESENNINQINNTSTSSKLDTKEEALVSNSNNVKTVDQQNNDNQEDAAAKADREAQIAAGESMAEYSKYINKHYPLVRHLGEMESRLYSVSICDSKEYPDDKLKIAICVYIQDPEISSSYPGNSLTVPQVNEALKERYQPYIEKQIKNLGFNPKDYEIIYVDNNK